MGRLIEANALLSEMEKYSDDTARFKNEYLFGMQQRLETCIELVEDAPTVDAVPVVHGRWQWVSSTYDRTPCEMRYWCSKCHHETITHGSEPWEKFCPNCGALMDGKDGEQHD